MSATARTGRRRRPTTLTPMQTALLEAAKRRIARDPEGQVVLPIGTVEVGELAKVLAALDRIRQGKGR